MIKLGLIPNIQKTGSVEHKLVRRTRIYSKIPCKGCGPLHKIGNDIIDAECCRGNVPQIKI